MISTILTNLSSAFSRVFVIGIVPLLLFLVLHGLVADAVFPAARIWIGTYVLPEFEEAGLLTIVAMLLIVTFAYVWSSLTVVMRDALEGKYFGKSLSTFLGTRYNRALSKALEKRDTARDQLSKLEQKRSQWGTSIRQARLASQRLRICTYARRSSLTRLLQAQARSRDIDVSALDREMQNMVTVLQTSSADLVGDAASGQLDADLRLLRWLVLYTHDRRSSELADALESVEFDYGGQKLTATRMGNIAQSTAHYAQTRYGMRLDLFWSRLQEVVSKDGKFSAQLDDANTRLDFAVTLYWQTLIFTLTWVAILPFWSRDLGLFLTIAMAGAVASLVWYRLALQNYRALASHMRAAIDLHRHGLLRDLHMATPRSLAHERALWNGLEQHVAHGSRADIAFEVKV